MYRTLICSLAESLLQEWLQTVLHLCYTISLCPVEIKGNEQSSGIMISKEKQTNC